MNCKEVLELLMGYLDGEIDGEDRVGVEQHLEGCESCRNEERAYRRLGQMTESLEFIEPTEPEWRAHWKGIYNRLERGFGWLFLAIGGVLLAMWGIWHLVSDFFLDASYSLFLRIGVGVTTAGAAVLLVSVARERLRLYRVDRYNEVEL